MIAKNKTICLNMIVKNESKVIERCLNSVVHLIDYWVIVDTGSTDGTQEIILDFMQKHNIPGKLFERPWKNFDYNRNEALALAKNTCDYLLFIDADEYLEYDEDCFLPDLDKDFYYVTVEDHGCTFKKRQLVNNHLDWIWTGVVHESINSPQAKSSADLLKVKTIYTCEGHSWTDPKKYLKHALLLENALKEDPQNMLYIHYLAQSYQNAKEYAKALEVWNKRISMEKGPNAFWALLQKGNLERELNYPSKDVCESYYQAFYECPSRADSLYYLMTYCREKGDPDLAYQVGLNAKQIPFPKEEISYVIKWVYDYGILLELAYCAVLTGRKEEGLKIYHELLNRKDLSEKVKFVVQMMLKAAEQYLSSWNNHRNT